MNVTRRERLALSLSAALVVLCATLSGAWAGFGPSQGGGGGGGGGGSLQAAYNIGAGIVPTAALGPVTISPSLNAFTNGLNVTQVNNSRLGILVTGGGISSIATDATSERFGNGALSVNTGSSNTACGALALQKNTSGTRNSALGYGALNTVTTNSDNSALGYLALSVSTGTFDSAFGSTALQNNTSGNANSAFGYAALSANTSGGNNSAFGSSALLSNVSGLGNSAFGESSLLNSTTNNDSAFGSSSLLGNTTGGNNSAFGRNAGYAPNGNSANANTTGSNNTYLGYQTGATSAVQVSNTTTVGYQALAGGANSTTLGAGSSDGGFANSTVIGQGLTATAANQTTIGGTLTWPAGRALATKEVVGPSDDFIGIYGSANGTNGALLTGDPTSTKPAYIEVDGTKVSAFGGQIFIQGGITEVVGGNPNFGSGSWINILPVVGLAGNGKSDGYTRIQGVFTPTGDGAAALGSTSLGYSLLHLSAAAPISWGAAGGDTGISRVAPGVSAFGNGTAGDFSGRIQSGWASIGSQTVTSNNPALNVDQTWNAPGTTVDAVNVNVVNTAASSASGLLNLRVNGTPNFIVQTTGCTLKNNSSYGWTSGASAQTAGDTAIARVSSSVVCVTQGSGTTPNGTISVAQIAGGVHASTTTNVTLDSTATFWSVDASGGAKTEQLPNATGLAGVIFVVSKSDSTANAVTLTTTSAQTINGAATLVISTQWQSYALYSDGSNWRIW